MIQQVPEPTNSNYLQSPSNGTEHNRHDTAGDVVNRGCAGELDGTRGSGSRVTGRHGGTSSSWLRGHSAVHHGGRLSRHGAGRLNGHGARWQETPAESTAAGVEGTLRIARALCVEVSAAGNQHGIASEAIHVVGALVLVGVWVALGTKGERASRGDDG